MLFIFNELFYIELTLAYVSLTSAIKRRNISTIPIEPVLVNEIKELLNAIDDKCFCVEPVSTISKMIGCISGAVVPVATINEMDDHIKLDQMFVSDDDNDKRRK